MSLEKQLRLCYNNNQVDLIVDMGVGIGGDKWPAAEKFCYFLTNRHWKEFYQQLLTNKTCLELGSGNGLVGILISKVFAISKVVITDLSSHINLIERNVKLNKMDSQRQCPILDNSKDNSDTVSCSSVQNNICEVLSCDWFDKNPLSNHKYDFIFVLECVYNEELFQPLIDCIQHNSHAHTITFLGLTRDFASPKFFDLLKDNDYYYRKIPDHAFVGSSSISEDNSQSNSVQFDENSAWNTPATEKRIGIFIVYKK